MAPCLDNLAQSLALGLDNLCWQRSRPGRDPGQTEIQAWVQIDYYYFYYYYYYYYYHHYYYYYYYYYYYIMLRVPARSGRRRDPREQRPHR